MTHPTSPNAKSPQPWVVAKRRDLAVGLLLAVATLAVYWPVGGHDFVELDDREYVVQNHHVQGGLTWENVGWAFTTGHAANWHPLTWLSHMLDCQLFGLWAGGHHLTSVLLHVASSILLYVVLRQMTGAVGRSAVVAALFALHPLHVESVAWVAERKDVLSTLFWMLTMLAYVRYARKPSVGRYAAVAALLALGLMAKPMLVTLPLVLLLVDWWPLRRVAWGQAGGGGAPRATVRRLIAEKVPLLALSAASSVVTYLVQRQAGAMGFGEKVPFVYRFQNALASYVRYVDKMFRPTDMAVYYPYSPEFVSWQAAGVVLLVGMTVLSLALLRRRPYVAVGWFWYVGMLVPVIGLVQVGSQAMADRYTYVPLIGVAIVAVWSAADLLAGRRWGRPALGAAAAAAILACLVLTRTQVGYWADDKTLFQHALTLGGTNVVARCQVGSALMKEKKYDEAVRCFAEGLQTSPNAMDLRDGLAQALTAQGRFDEAIEQYRRIMAQPMSEPHRMHNGLAKVLVAQGNVNEAVHHCEEALHLKPDYPEAHNNLASILAGQGKAAEAIARYREALRLRPAYPEAHNNLASVLASQGKAGEAIAHGREALRLRPAYAEAHGNLGVALAAQGKFQEAVGELREAMRLEPESVDILNNLAWFLATCPDAPSRNGAEAVRLAEQVCRRTARKEPSSLDTLAAAYAEAGRFPEAVAAAETAIGVARKAGRQDLAAAVEKRLELYRAGKPYREAPTAP